MKALTFPFENVTVYRFAVRERECQPCGAGPIFNARKGTGSGYTCLPGMAQSGIGGTHVAAAL